MFTKKVIVFAVGSMFAAGATLASNVSFGQRAARWIAENMDFIGPISGLVNAVVRAPDSNRSSPVLSFQVERGLTQNGLVRGGAASEISAYDNKYGVNQSVLNGTIENQRGVYSDADRYTGGTLLASGAPIQFGNVVGENQSQLNNLAKSFLKDAKSVDGSDLWAMLNTKGGAAGDFSVINLPTIAGASVDPSTGTADVPLIIAAATSGDPVNGAAAAGGAATGGAAAGDAGTATTAKPTATTAATATAKVPVPGVLGLLLAGFIAIRLTRDKRA